MATHLDRLQFFPVTQGAESMKPKPSPAVVFTSRFTVVLMLALMSGTTAYAQIDRAVLEGTVIDPTGAAIRGASVEILEVETGIAHEQATNSNGYYRLSGLAVGHYTVTVTDSGFKTKVIDDVEMLVGQTRTLDVRLVVGGLAEKVEVKASNELSNRTSAEASTVIDSTQIENLPNN